jgi:hypothetical protein
MDADGVKNYIAYLLTQVNTPEANEKYATFEYYPRFFLILKKVRCSNNQDAPNVGH